MAKFTVRFDSFIEAGRKRILEERNQFRMDIAESKGMCHDMYMCFIACLIML